MSDTPPKSSRQLLRACAKMIKERRETPRFIGRRSIDKKHGEVIEFQDGPHEDAVTVEIINLPNFEGESAASKRAEVLSDRWTAARIIELIEAHD